MWTLHPPSQLHLPTVNFILKLCGLSLLRWWPNETGYAPFKTVCSLLNSGCDLTLKTSFLSDFYLCLAVLLHCIVFIATCNIKMDSSLLTSNCGATRHVNFQDQLPASNILRAFQQQMLFPQQHFQKHQWRINHLIIGANGISPPVAQGV